MPIILLIRHAENDFTRKHQLAGRLPDVHLNDNGRKQAQQLGDYLSKTPIKQVYSSPLERAMETAEMIAKPHDLGVIQEEGLIEVDIGEWQGKPIGSLRRLKPWKVVQRSPSLAVFPGGETIQAAQARISQAISTLAKNHAAKEMIACVSHADPIKLALAYFAGMPLDQFQRLCIGLASVSTIYLDEWNVQIINVNVSTSLIIR